ncbi:response regulator [Tundrisphaera sp. TA3]|uniref:response regulator n=1 Tax=Tundrisphaera sp. TA3 TaxID=3435775 RepID=UPI003EBB704A
MPSALIVEDEPEANELLAMLVQLRGYRTDSAFTGGEALEIARRRRPDVVFLDLMLPDINGYEVCRALRAERTTGAIPVVMVTARLADQNRVQGFRVGAAEYVPKPYTPDQIFEALARAGDWRRGLVEGAAEGTIALDASAEVDLLLGLSRLRGLVLARTSLPEGIALELDRLLIDVAARAVDWGRQHGAARVASLDYRCDDRGVEVTIRDESGWFADDPPGDADGLGGLLARGGAIRVSPDAERARVVLSAADDRP